MVVFRRIFLTFKEKKRNKIKRQKEQKKINYEFLKNCKILKRQMSFKYMTNWFTEHKT